MHGSPVKGQPMHNHTEQAATRVYTFAQRRRRIKTITLNSTNPSRHANKSRREVQSNRDVRPTEAPTHNRRGGQHTHNSAQTLSKARDKQGRLHRNKVRNIEKMPRG